MKHLLNVLLIALLSATPAVAGPISFNFTFTGSAYDGNNSVATGSITFDGSLLANPGRNLWDPGNNYSDYGTATPGLVTALSVTVTGSSAGNGTFTLADFNGVLFDTSSLALNLTQPLVGQPTSSPNSATWGTPDPVPSSNPAASYTGDFQLFAISSSAAPTGISPFQLGTDYGNGDGLQLASFTSSAAVPEPGSLALFGVGLAALVWTRKVSGRLG